MDSGAGWSSMVQKMRDMGIRCFREYGGISGPGWIGKVFPVSGIWTHLGKQTKRDFHALGEGEFPLPQRTGLTFPVKPAEAGHGS